MPPSPARTTTALALLLLATTAACAAGARETPSAPHTTAPPPAAGQTDQRAGPTDQRAGPTDQRAGWAERLRLPLDAYVLTGAETLLVEDAQEILMGRCMKGLGLEWKPLPRVDARDIEPQNLGRYGADPVDALRHGYHPRPDPPSVVRRDRAWDERETLPTDVRRAAYGPSGTGGCLRTARQQLAGGVAAPDHRAFNELTATALETSRRAPELRPALRAWRACMAKAGFDYPDPLAAAANERWITPGPTPAEHATARADASCQRSSKVMEAWAAAETRVQHRLVQQNAARLNASKARKDHWLAAARRVLDDEGRRRFDPAPAWTSRLPTT
ncbi:hypothetical protein AB0N23_02965 [Streptomyces sp. NPDC052644]